MKKVLLAMALVLALALPAQAEVNGVYAGIKIIDSIQATGNMSKDNDLKGFGIGSYSQNTIGGGIYVGYDFYPKFQVPLRTEIEYAIRSNMTTAWTKNDVLGVAGANSELDYTMGLQTVFFNAYLDWHNSTAFTPYIGAGAGLGFINNKVSGTVTDANGVSNDIGTADKMNTVFAWNVGAGVSYAMTENISADLAYRFVGLGQNDMDGVKSHPYANEVSLGLRFTF